MTRNQILDAAKLCVSDEREKTYGSPENNFECAAQMISGYLGYPVDAADVAIILALVKISRMTSGVNISDNYLDLAGYAAIAGELTTDDRSGDAT